MATVITVEDLEEINGSTRVESVTWTAADATGMSFANTGREILLVKNLHISTLAIVCTGVADEDDRTGDLTVSTEASEHSVTGHFLPRLFNDASGIVNMTIATDTALWVAVVKDTKKK